MSEFRGRIEPGILPFEDGYDQLAQDLDAIQALARARAYSTPHSFTIAQAVRPNADFFPGGKFYDKFADLLTRQQEPTDEELLDIGVDIGASITEEYTTPRNLILGYVNARLQMELLRVGFAGRNFHPEIFTPIRHYLRTVITEALPLDGMTNGTSKSLEESLRIAHQVDRHHRDIFTLLFNSLNSLHSAHTQLRGYNDFVSRHYANGENFSEQDRQNVDSGIYRLNQDAMRVRKYGTKPAYIEASTGGAWVFYDGESFRDHLIANGGSESSRIPHFAAIVFHVPESDLSGVDLNVESFPLDEIGRPKHVKAGLMAASPDFDLIIQFNGSMTVDFPGLVPLSAAMADNPEAVRKLEAEVASLFYDLSMPIDAGTRQSLRTYAQMTAEERESFNPIRDLLIPRLRQLRITSESSPERPRIVRRHDVTWFVRLLPSGWHASPEAVANAKQVGIELAANETFVRAHERGQGNRIYGYHAVRRLTELEPGVGY